MLQEFLKANAEREERKAADEKLREENEKLRREIEGLTAEKLKLIEEN